MMKGTKLVAAGIGILIMVIAVPIVASAQGMMGPQIRTTGPVTMDQAINLVQQALARLGNSDLVPMEIMEFSNNFYVVVAEKSTGIGAFELIVERYGFVHPEPGPNMMWNTKYGHMAGWGAYGMMGGGMMGGGSGMMGGPAGPGHAPRPAAPTGPALTRDQARQVIQTWLNQTFPGAKAQEGMPFYGYFTFDFKRIDKVVGMASVNALSRQVWYHTWHGTFIREKELK